MTPTDSIVASWPHRWYGFWRSNESETNLPDIEEVAGANWSVDDKKRVLSYLDGAPTVVAMSGPNTKCLLCEELIGGSVYRSDGVWLWPVDLSHYLNMHDVALPESFLQHIRDANYEPPQECPTAIEALPWP